MALSEEKRMSIVRKVIQQYSLDYSRSHFGSPVPRSEKDIREVIKTSIYDILLEDAQQQSKGATVDVEEVKKIAAEDALVVTRWLPVCMDSMLWAQRRL